MKATWFLLLWVGSAVAAELPNPELTPGDVEPRLTKGVLCERGFRTGPWRRVSSSVARRVYASYGKRPPCCEVDHLVPLELGGSNSIKNLWPQAWAEAKLKDQLENRLHLLVCLGRLPLEDAQKAIAKNWWEAYQTYTIH